jgi:hypothetical protein
VRDAAKNIVARGVSPHRVIEPIRRDVSLSGRSVDKMARLGISKWPEIHNTLCLFERAKPIRKSRNWTKKASDLKGNLLKLAGEPTDGLDQLLV